MTGVKKCNPVAAVQSRIRLLLGSKIGISVPRLNRSFNGFAGYCFEQVAMEHRRFRS
jgi:hypothetical protein